MKKYGRFISYVCTAVISAAVCFAAVSLWLVAAAGGTDNLERGAKLVQVLRVVDENFVEEADLDAATDAAASAMIASLGDQWSYYMTAEDYEAYQLHTQNSYRGIGVTIRAAENGFLIVDVPRGTPAYEAGLLPGETIVSVAGETTAGMETAELQEKIASFGDGEFTLGIVGTDGTERSVSISAAAVYSSPVSSRMLDGDIGYIELSNFSAGCAQDAIAAIEQLVSDGAKALVFDVRYNGGGYVSEMTDLLDYLLPEGVIFTSISRDGDEETVTSDADCVDLPMAVLINDNSYSAAELFAAQLHEYGWAQTVGESTTGKGRSQVTYTLYDGSAVHISHEAYITSQGHDLAAEGGIDPDFAVELTDEEKTELYYGILPIEDDIQLRAAVGAVRQELD